MSSGGSNALFFLESIELTFNGEPIYTRLLKTGDDNKHRFYQEFLRVTGARSAANTIDISKKAFENYFFMVCVDSVGDSCNGVHRHLEAEKKGILSVNLTFKSGQSRPSLTMLIYSSAHKFFTVSGIDRQLEVSF